MEFLWPHLLALEVRILSPLRKWAYIARRGQEVLLSPACNPAVKPFAHGEEQK